MQETKPPYDNIFHANENEPKEKTDEQVVTLQEQLTSEQDKRKEERFLWITVTTILMDGLIFAHNISWLGCLLIVTIELPVLIVLARRLGLEEIEQYLHKVEDKLPNFIPGKEKSLPEKIDKDAA